MQRVVLRWRRKRWVSRPARDQAGASTGILCPHQTHFWMKVDWCTGIGILLHAAMLDGV